VARRLVGRQNLVAKPGGKRVGIRHGEWPKSEQGPNLSAQAIAVATGQIEITERLRGDGQLLRKILYAVGRNLAAASRETPSVIFKGKNVGSPTVT